MPAQITYELKLMRAGSLPYIMLWIVIVLMLGFWLLRYGFGVQHWLIPAVMISIWLLFLASLLSGRRADI